MVQDVLNDWNTLNELNRFACRGGCPEAERLALRSFLTTNRPGRLTGNFIDFTRDGVYLERYSLFP
jgi:hypothetical protein